MEQTVLQIALHQIDELSFSSPKQLPQLTTKNGDSDAIQIGFSVAVTPDIDAEKVDLRLGVIYYILTHNVRTTLIDYKTRFEFQVIDLDKHVKSTLAQHISIDRDLLSMLLGVAIGSTRGMLALKTAGTDWARYPLPIINLTTLLHSLHTGASQDKIVPAAFKCKVV